MSDGNDPQSLPAATAAKPDPSEDPRLDPRLTPLCKMLTATQNEPKTADEIKDDHETLVKKAAENRNVGLEAAFMTEQPFQLSAAPLESVERSEGTFVSSPDGNTVRYCFMRPADAPKDSKLPVVYYIHGGGMTQLSCFYAMYQSWGRFVCARTGMAVFLVEFRNALLAGFADGEHSSGEVKKYPGGLNDCVSGVKYLHSHAAQFNVDANKISIAGESGGGNLTLATGMQLKKDGDIGLVRALVPLCPYVLGNYPDPEYPSTITNNGILLKVGGGGVHDYSKEAYDAKDPFAWPIFAEKQHLEGLPPCLLSMNECDPLLDEGLTMYRKLRNAGVAVQARVVPGTCHAAEVFLSVPDISKATVDAIRCFLNDVFA